jgi:aspartate/methionine/tyrosine aminotransferase
MSFATRTESLSEEGAYSVLARCQMLEAQGKDIIHLEIGQPDFDTFSHVSLAGIRAITTGQTRYTPPLGIPALREALAQDAGRRRGVELSADWVVVAPGTKPILQLPLLALIEPGDEVLYPDPGFPTYAGSIGLAGGVPIPVKLLEERDFDLDMEGLEAAITPRTRMIILNSPGNPTGGILPPATLARIAELACQHDLWVLSDEIYSRLVFDGESRSILSMPGMMERTIVADGYSKTYAMTGWRLGYGLMPPALVAKMNLLLTYVTGCTAAFTQYAGLEAVTAPQDDVDAMVDTFRRRRDFMVERLQAIPGIQCAKPQGAFYVFPSIRAFGLSSNEMANRLLDEVGVAVLPGTAFGQNGEGFIRLAYANSLENIGQALDRMAGFLATLR